MTDAERQQRAVQQSMLLLRKDAMERGYGQLEIAYGWSAILIGSEILEAVTLRIIARRHA